MLPCRRPRILWLSTLSILCIWAYTGDAHGQLIQRNVGGVIISPQGVLQLAPGNLVGASVAELRELVQQVQPELREPQAWRTISLRQLQAALQTLGTKPISAELRYLGGLQRVEAMIVDPENQDLLLAGPCDEWLVHPSGDVIGATNGKPILLLDDLLVALRSVEPSRQHGITCSIDPTSDGRQALDAYLSTVRRFDRSVASRVEQALGDQVVSITGVASNTHFAAVMAAADYQMKSYAMHLQPAPIANLPSFLELMRARKSVPRNLMPRWWLAVDYAVPQCSEDRHTWLLGESRVKVLTEDEMIKSDGSVTGTGRVHPVAKRWADNFTSRFDELETADIVFGRLHQLMDWALVAAIMDHHQLAFAARCDLTLLADATSPLKLERWATPRSVPSHASFVRVGRQFVITASGGVQMDPWSVIGQPPVTADLASVTAREHKRQVTKWCDDYE